MVNKNDVIRTRFEEKFALFGKGTCASCENVSKEHIIETEARVPKLGLMLVGLGGNNGSTLVAGILANKRKMQWETKQGRVSANFYGSLT